ncbi:hypothetical protein LINPERPRIM_LOCUS37459, partial [Linum perenne]
MIRFNLTNIYPQSIARLDPWLGRIERKSEQLKLGFIRLTNFRFSPLPDFGTNWPGSYESPFSVQIKSRNRLSSHP